MPTETTASRLPPQSRFRPFSGDAAQISIALRPAVGKRQLVLYFHGGLSGRSYIETKLGPYLLRTMFDPAHLPDAHTVFVEWETSPLSPKSLITNGVNAFKEALGKDMLVVAGRIAGWLGDRLGVDISLPGADKAVPERANGEDGIEVAATDLLGALGLMGPVPEIPGDKALEDALDALIADAPPALMDDFMTIDAYRAEADKGVESVRVAYKVARVVYRIVKRYARANHHGGYTTIIEELLRIPILGGLQVSDLAQSHWMQTVCSNGMETWDGPTGRAFLTELNALCERNGESFSVDLVSHSAGSIPLCHLLRVVHNERGAYPHIRIGNVIPVAPAARMKLFFDTVVSSSPKPYERFRMFALTDDAEKADDLVSILYPRSLLYFVSGVADDDANSDMILMGLHRHFARNRPPYDGNDYEKPRHRERYGDLRLCRDFLGRDAHAILSPTPGVDRIGEDDLPGLISDGTSHSGTKHPHESPRLAKSIIYLLSHGATLPSGVNSNPWCEVAQVYL